MHPSQTTASRGPSVNAMLQKEKGMGEVWLNVVALHRPCVGGWVGGEMNRRKKEGGGVIYTHKWGGGNLLSSIQHALPQQQSTNDSPVRTRGWDQEGKETVP